MHKLSIVLLLASVLVVITSCETVKPGLKRVTVNVRGQDYRELQALVGPDFIIEGRHGYALEVATTEEIVQKLSQRFTVRNTQQTIIRREGYMDYNNITNFLHDIATSYPTLTRLTSIGKSVQGRELWVIEIAKRPGVNDGLPRFKYIANMHGDEVVGRELMVRLIKYLLTNYPSNERVKKIIDSMHIFIMPTMNPDGFERGTRGNANGVDLNRNFPDQFFDNNDDPKGRQPETRAIMEWLKNSPPFVLSANFHGGDVVANYPFDGTPDRRSYYSACDDDDVFRRISYAYAQHNPTMLSNPEFKDGITNGADWYPLYGGMQDYNYLWHRCMEITLEVSYDKWPSYSRIESYWNENLNSMLTYIEQVNTGLRGVITSASTGKPVKAEIKVASATTSNPSYRSLAVLSDPETGWYYRLLNPGKYVVSISAPGYAAWKDEVYVGQDITFLNVTLSNAPSAESSLPTSTIVIIIISILIGVFAIILGIAYWFCWKQQRKFPSDSNGSATYTELTKDEDDT